MGKVTTDQLFIEELWGQILGPGMATVFHTHYNKAIPQRNGWGFVYYLQADQDMGNLALHAEHGSLDFTKDIRPETNLLVVFPLNTSHYTRRNTTNKERITISGNIIFKGGKTNDDNVSSGT